MLHHICLISDQNVAELLGALLCAPSDVHIHAVTTPVMAARAASFEKTCWKNRIACSIHPLPVARMTEIDRLLDDVLAAHSGGSWAVNITGGTKLMTLGAYAWAVKNRIPAFYIDTANRTYEFYSDGRWQSLPLASVLKYEALLNLYGYEVWESDSSPVPAGHGLAARKMLDLAASEEGLEALHILNERSVTAGPRFGLKVSYASRPYMDRLLAICKAAGQLDYDGSMLVFRDEAARRWCNGIWLEQYVQAILADLEAENRISSWAVNVKIAGPGYGNELDAVFTAHNRLYVIECKTARLAGKPAAASILYKADSLKDRVGGIFTRSMLCALDDLTPVEAQRASNMGIKTVTGARIMNLREILIKIETT